MGCIVKVCDNQYFPSDLILINSNIPKGICYVETKNLDGETNLKHKQAWPECISRAQTVEEVTANFTGVKIRCETPNNNLYTFTGNMTFPDGTEIALSPDNILLRGSSLRNTEWVFGIALFTGMESKVM